MAVAKFRSRARVIDLLGRQQIADAPTAVGELFKNALDAGARNAWVDYWEEENVLTIRDDGLGMRLEDVTGKWLVLATESRHGKRRLDDGWARFADPDQQEWLKEPSYGEKGIGRLSVATLGRMTLLWTVWGKGRQKTGTLCLVHWNLFQHPTMLFEDLPIPYSQHTSPPSIQDIARLFKELGKNKQVQAMLSDLSWDEHLREQLKEDLAIPIAESLKPVEFSWDAGTIFCIFSPSDQVEELFLKNRNEIDPTDDYPPDWLKAYHAFSTFWDPFHHQQGRQFQIHPSRSGKPLLRTHRYWEPDDFKQSDHYVRITVSSDGFAKGFVKFYGKRKLVYERQLKSLPKGHSSPGEFLVEIGYVQGNKESSPLPDDVHREIFKRLEHAGGFSIYLNNVRVQPYGGIDSDFAGFEERRLKNAGRYYFSTRRMFGGLFIASKEKTNLSEKAGREGFVVNGARRGLRLWVEDLFVDLADTYFGRKANREDKNENKRRKESEAAKERLEKQKVAYLSSIRVHRAWLRDFDVRVKTQVQSSRGLLASEGNSAPGTYLANCEKEIGKVQLLADELRATPDEPPSGVIIEEDILASVQDYLSKRDIAIRNLSREIANQRKLFNEYVGRARGLQEQERKIANRIGTADISVRKSIETLIEPALQRARLLESELEQYAEREIETLISIRKSHVGDLTPKKIAGDKNGKAVKTLEQAIQLQLDSLERESAPKIRRLVSDISHLTDNTSSALLLSEQSKEIQLLRERLQFLAEVAQLGLILETATHEYEKQVGDIKNGIKILCKTLRGGELSKLNVISESFDIIDERIRLFDPLIRRKTAVDQAISGSEIAQFITQRFQKEANSGLVKFTPAFLKATWANAKKPIMFGAIYNIFHNAIYWSNKSLTKPLIQFSAIGEMLIISDSGPGISVVDAQRIFEPGFSRRPYGRGLGLYIAKEALRGTGFELYCPSEPELGALEGANFIIVSKSHTSSDADY